MATRKDLLDSSASKIKALASGFKKGAEDVLIDPLTRSVQNIVDTGSLVSQATGASIASKINPQWGARIASEGINRQKRAEQLINNPIDTLKQQLIDSTKLALVGKGLSVAPKTLATTAAIGAGAGSIFSKPGERLYGFGHGIGSAPLYSGMGVFSQKITSPVLNKVFPNIVNNAAITGRAGQAAFNVGENVGLDIATGDQNAFDPRRLAFSALLGFAGRPFAEADNVRADFRMTKPEMDRLVEAEEVLLDASKWVDKNLGYFDSPAAREQAVKQAESTAIENIRNIASRRLPDKYLEKVNGDPKKIIKALIDLNYENKLADVPGMGFVDSTQASKEVTKSPQSKLSVGQDLEQPKTQSDFSTAGEVLQKEQPLSPPKQRQYRVVGKDKQIIESSEEIISNAKKEIGSITEKPSKSVKEVAKDLYTQWVDRYYPITEAVGKVKSKLKTKGAELRPEYDPTYLVRKLTGAGGIADYRYQTELKPVIDELDSLGIDKLDMDVYLKAKRDFGFGTVGRDIKGSDPKIASQRITALQSKYGPQIEDVAKKFYDYQNKGFQEMVDAGFISQEAAQTIRAQNPDYVPFDRIMDEVDNYLGIPTRKTMQGSQPIKKIEGSNREIYSPVEGVIANTFKQRAAIEKNNVAKAIANLQNIVDMGFEKVSKAGNDTITVWNNGQKEYWRVGDKLAETSKGLNEENMNTILKLLTVPASILRQGATGRNPEFMIPNIVRDQLDAAVASKYGYIPFIDYVSGLKSMVTNDDVYQKWQTSGAKIDLGEMSGRKSIQQSFDKTANKKLYNKLGKFLDVLGKYSEQPTRVGLYKKAYRKTGNELMAMLESRDSTVDFARMGSKMRVANSIDPFLNVGVQGFDKLIRATKDNPGKVLTMATIYGAAPAVSTTLYNLVNYPEQYTKIPQYEKDSNFILVTGENEDGTVKYVTFPKGNIIPVIANPIQSFLEFAAENSTQTVDQFATQFISSTLPVVGEGQSLQEVGIKTIGQNLPQFVKPVTENLLNKSFWKYDPTKEQAKEIVPYYMQDKEDYLQKYDFTPELYQKIGAVTNTSPLKVQNLMEGYLAGYVKIPAQIVEMVKSVSEGKEIETNDRTILRRFVKETYPTKTKVAPVEKPKTPLMERVSGKASAAELPTQTEDLKTLYADAQKTIKSYKNTSSKIRTGLVDNKTLEMAQSDLVEARALIDQIETTNPELLNDPEVAKMKFEISGEDMMKSGDTLYYKNDKGNTAELDLNFEMPELKTSSNLNLQKDYLSDYKGELTKLKNRAKTAFGLGVISQSDLDKVYDAVDKAKASVAKPKQIKKPKFVPLNVKIKKISGIKNIKPIKSIKTPKLKEVKL